MNTDPIILVIDQGTTSSRAVLMDCSANIIALSNTPIQQIYPKSGWVEHNVKQIWESVKSTVLNLKNEHPNHFSRIASIGITNQRETTVVWDNSNGKPLHNAIVWQDTRTSEYCKDNIHLDNKIKMKTGLLLNPYFSATKIRWILNTYDPNRSLCNNNKIIAGTIDSYLIWNLTGRKSFYTDHTNGSRTLLMNIHTGNWDDELLSDFNIPKIILPEIKPSVFNFGSTLGLDFLPDGIPIMGVAGDQQASLVGHRCHSPGQAKCTFGTGAFLLSHTGDYPIKSDTGLLTTMAATTGNKLQYCLEGSVFIAGAAVQWLRDGLGLFEKASESEFLSLESDHNSDIVFIPALSGLGCPYWNSDFQGTILGLTRKTTKKEITRAALEGVAHQVADLLDAISANCSNPLKILATDGGMTENKYFNDLLAKTTGVIIQTSTNSEMTSIGAGILAGLGSGFMKLDDYNSPIKQEGKTYNPNLTSGMRLNKRNRWKKAIQALEVFYKPN